MTTNNDNLNGTNPISPWIRPGLAMLFGAVLAIMLVVAFFVAVQTGKWEIALGLLAVAGIPPLWYFNVRTGDKTVEKMVGMFGLGSSFTSQAGQGATTTAHQPVLPPTPSPAPPTPQPAPVVTEPLEPFDVQAFHKEVLADVKDRHGEVNPATVFYTAKDKGDATTCRNIEQAQDYWDYLVPLAYDAETFIKSQTTPPPGAVGPVCQPASPEYALIQSELAKCVRYRDSVYVLARTNIDWKTALGPNATLVKVGVYAEELVRRASQI